MPHKRCNNNKRCNRIVTFTGGKKPKRAKYGPTSIRQQNSQNAGRRGRRNAAAVSPILIIGSQLTVGTSNTGTPLQVVIPTHADGDLLILVFSRWTTIIPNTPAGWTRITNLNNNANAGSDDVHSATFWKIASSEPSTVGCNATDVSARVGAGMIWALRDFHTDKFSVTPIADHVSDWSNDYTPPADPITTGFGNSLILRFAHLTDNEVQTAAPPAGFFEDGENVANDANFCAAHRFQEAAGVDSPGDWLYTASSATADGGQTVLAIKPLD